MLTILFVSCKSETKVIAPKTDTVLLQLYSDSASINLEREFSRYALKQEKVVSRPMNIYLFAFDSSKIADTSLIKVLKQSKLVKEAQQNREVTTRKN